MDLPRRGLKALLVYKIVFILETNDTDTFNLRQCVQQLAQFKDEEALLAVVVYCVEKVRTNLYLQCSIVLNSTYLLKVRKYQSSVRIFVRILLLVLFRL